MSKISINIAEKGIIHHLKMGGDIDDQTGTELVTKFSSTVLNDSQISSLARQYGVTQQEICLIFMSMIRALMPNPCVKAAGLMLVPTVVFMEPYRFEQLIHEIRTGATGLSAEQQNSYLVEASKNVANQIWTRHTDAKGEAKFEIFEGTGGSSTGCMSVLLLTVSIAISVFGAINLIG